MVVDDHDLTREAVCEARDEENDIEVVAFCSRRSRSPMSMTESARQRRRSTGR
jgi:DNA-binding NarL/FixJ family response regulator